MDKMSYRFGAGRYFQEKDILDDSGEEVARYGKRAYVIGGPRALEIVRDRITASFVKEELEYCFEVYDGFPSEVKIENLAKHLKEEQWDVLVGAGGGRIMDLSKAASSKAGIPIVLIPTQAATCAAFTPLSVIYSPEGRSERYIHIDHEVSSVLVDDEVMLTQTPRQLKAGILDAMAKYVEIDYLQTEGHREQLTLAQDSADYLAKYTYDVLKRIAMKAVRDLEQGTMSRELHDAIYINIALTGVVSSLMRGIGQTQFSHAFESRIRCEFLDEVRGMMHGELVALGMIPQWALNKKEDQIEEFLHFMRELGMPCTLQEVGIAPTEDNKMKMKERLLKFHYFIDNQDAREYLDEAIALVAGERYDI